MMHRSLTASLVALLRYVRFLKVSRMSQRMYERLPYNDGLDEIRARHCIEAADAYHDEFARWCAENSP